MGYKQAVAGRYLASKGRPQQDSSSKQAGPKKKTEFPLIYAVLVAILFVFLTGGKQEYLLPSIVIPLALWIIVKVRG